MAWAEVKDFARDAWQITVHGLRVRIDFYGLHYRTSPPFRPQLEPVLSAKEQRLLRRHAARPGQGPQP